MLKNRRSKTKVYDIIIRQNSQSINIRLLRRDKMQANDTEIYYNRWTDDKSENLQTRTTSEAQ